ncbi:MAG: hypothetical protein WC634_01915 [archaeon]
MKKAILVICLLALVAILSGCITTTVDVQGPASIYGDYDTTKVEGNKIIFSNSLILTLNGIEQNETILDTTVPDSYTVLIDITFENETDETLSLPYLKVKDKDGYSYESVYYSLQERMFPLEFSIPANDKISGIKLYAIPDGVEFNDLVLVGYEGGFVTEKLFEIPLNKI